VNEGDVAARIESFVRETFDVAPEDPNFGRQLDLFEYGYVDSVGLTELLAFVEDEFGIEVPDEELLSDEFASIEGISRVLTRLHDR
jgi:methoxymalonate biosynthesis acyl carrier protein